MKIALCMSWGDTTHFLNTAYIKYITDSGFEPILICPGNDIKRIAEECDGLMLPGGIDLDPTFYGEENYSSYKCAPDRDNFERHAYHTFLTLGKPIFGICRGFQLIVNEFIRSNQEFNGELLFYQHIGQHSLASDRGVSRSVATHSVMANTKKMYGGENEQPSRIFVNSIHHQALQASLKTDILVGKETGDRLEVISFTQFGMDTKAKKNSRIIEGIDIRIGESQVRAVQWHPEELQDTALLSHFFQGAVNEIKNTTTSNVESSS